MMYLSFHYYYIEIHALFLGKVYHNRIVVNIAPSELFRRDSSLVWPVHLGIVRVSKISILISIVSLFRISFDYTTLWNTFARKSWIEKMGGSSRISTIH